MNSTTSIPASNSTCKCRVLPAIVILICAMSLVFNYLQARRSANLQRQLNTILAEKEAQVGDADPEVELARLRSERDRIQQELTSLKAQVVSGIPAIGKAGTAETTTGAAGKSAEERVRLSALPGAKVTIDGTSTIHDWTVEGAIIGGFFEADAAALKSLVSSGATPSSLPLNARAESVIPIRSLKSKFTKMDEIMQEAMRMKESPRIQYWLTEMKPKPGATNGPATCVFQTQGQLAVSGVTNTIEMEISVQAEEGSRLRVRGSKQLKMTDFEIPPPSPSLAGGAIKTGDEVTVRFEWLLGPK